MEKYHKIQTVWLRDPETKYKTLLEGEWAKPEFGYLAENDWLFTEKVDGTNIRVHWTGSAYVANPSQPNSFIELGIKFGGRTDKAQIPPFLLDILQDLFPVEKFKTLYPDTPMTLYGEGYGAKIQKGGGNYRQDQSFVLFDMRIGDTWLQRVDVEDIGDKLGIDVVPLYAGGSLNKMVKLARLGFNSMWGNFRAEGIVARPKIELLDRNGHRIITKIKCKDFANV